MTMQPSGTQMSIYKRHLVVKRFAPPTHQLTAEPIFSLKSRHPAKRKTFPALPHIASRRRRNRRAVSVFARRQACWLLQLYYYYFVFCAERAATTLSSVLIALCAENTQAAGVDDNNNANMVEWETSSSSPA
jgi:hypothetical protein